MGEYGRNIVLEHCARQQCASVNVTGTKQRLVEGLRVGNSASRGGGRGLGSWRDERHLC